MVWDHGKFSQRIPEYICIPEIVTVVLQVKLENEISLFPCQHFYIIIVFLIFQANDKLHIFKTVNKSKIIYTMSFKFRINKDMDKITEG